MYKILPEEVSIRLSVILTNLFSKLKSMCIETLHMCLLHFPLGYSTAVTVFTLNISPVADAGPDHIICEGTTDTLRVTGTGSIIWSTGDTTATVFITPDSTSVYWVRLTNGSGCFTTDSITVTVITLPLADAGNDVMICSGQTTTLTANGGTSYLWDNAYSTSAINVSPALTTTYYVTVTANACFAADSVTVTVNQLPAADAGIDKSICIGDTTFLTATGSGSFYWNTGDTTATMYVSPSLTTTYTVTVTNANNCTATDNAIITVNSLPNADAGFNKSIKYGDTITLTATGGVEYLWNTSATSASLEIAPDSSSIYYVTVTDANGCVNTDDVTILVGTSSMPYPEAYWHKNDSIISTIAGISKVGIGTDTPTEKLTVAGNVLISDTLKIGVGLKINNFAGKGYSPDSLSTRSLQLLFADEKGNITPQTPVFWKCSPEQFPWMLGGNFLNGSSSQPEEIGTCNNYPFKMKTNSIERARITETGDFAIGASYALAKSYIYSEQTNLVYPAFAIGDYQPNTGKGGVNFAVYSNGNVGIGTENVHNAKLYIYGEPTESNPAIAVGNINPSQNGSPSGDYHFAVYPNGNVKARDVIVTINQLHPDYVFNIDYSLMPLAELEKYIKDNKHLPGVPSANEVYKNGLNLGEMQTVMLKKIEELTLYIIALSKENKILMERIQNLEN